MKHFTRRTIHRKKTLKEVFGQVSHPRLIIPAILAFLTGKDRFIPEMEYAENSLTFNLFRDLEQIFGREYGIRAEAAASIDGEGRVTRQFFTIESVLAFAEAVIRKQLEWKLVRVRVWIPVFSLPGGLPMPASPYLFAIATDTSAASTAGADTGKTLSYTVTGSNTLLLVHCGKLTAATTGVTWNGSAFTKVNSDQSAPSGDKVNMWAFVGATGTQNIVSSGTSTYNAFVATSYSGVNQSVTPDSSNGSSNASASPQTISTTVVASNCWTFLSLFSDNAAPVASTGSFLRRVGANIFITAFDSNGTVSTGSVSMATTYSPASPVAQVICSFAPTITDYSVSVNEVVTITESNTMKVNSFISVSDALTVTDVIVGLDFVFALSVFDAITITESVTVTNSQLGDINVNDALTITESVTVTNSQLGDISVSDTVTITEDVNIAFTFDISVSDDITVSENVEMTQFLGDINVFDAITITESVTVFTPDRMSGIAIMRSEQQQYPLGMDDETIL